MHNPLVKVIVFAAAMPLAAAAQVAPAPAPSPRAQRPADAPRPAPEPARAARPSRAVEPLVAPMPLLMDLDLDVELHAMRPLLRDLELDHELHAMRPMLEEISAKAADMRFELHELVTPKLADVAMEAAKVASAEAMVRVDAAGIARRAADVAAMAALEAPRLDNWTPSKTGDRVLDARPRAPWAQEDPADSLYRVAREALNRGEYRRAAVAFNEVTKKYPRSRYAQDSAYWEAFARYRIGTTEELRVALRILDGKGDLPLDVEQMLREGRGSSRENAIDIPTLRTRVLGALAARGDSDAARRLQGEAAQQGTTSCDREEVSVRAEALNALAQMDAAAAMPTVKKVLARRDECTVELRRRALYVVGRQSGSEAAAIILDVAKNDPDAGIRGDAMRWLSRVSGDAAIPHLEELLRTASDEPTQRAAVSALATIDSDAARRAVRTIIERADANERVRYDAIMSLSRERDGRAASPEDLAYLRSLYAKMPTTRLREAVLGSVSRVPAAENEQFLLGIARNVNEPAPLRAAALQRLGRMETVKVADIARLYDIADTRGMREQILHALSQRNEAEAFDKIMEIARKDTDPRIRSYAVSLLGRSKHERAKQLLKEIIEQQ